MKHTVRNKTTSPVSVGHEVHFFRSMLLVGGVALSVMAASAATDNNWRKVDGDANGSMDETAHWTGGAPTIDHVAVFPGSLGSYTVTIPAEYELEANFRANVVDGERSPSTGATDASTSRSFLRTRLRSTSTNRSPSASRAPTS
ncbi:MAG: hypothetical protein IJI35_17330 [Kiritimatiellae bacterium]|nr:hypothetical protein [Kiritimatiellia bacterium]